jgi:hypothetical protein
MKYHPISRPLPYQCAPPVMNDEPPATGYYELPLLGILWLHLAVVAIAMALAGNWGPAAGLGTLMLLVALRGTWILRKIAIEWDREVQEMTAGEMPQDAAESESLKVEGLKVEEEEKSRWLRDEARRERVSNLLSSGSSLKGGGK